MSEPKRGKHDETCLISCPNCLCNTCQKDNAENDDEEACCYVHNEIRCVIRSCAYYIKDEPTKKGADQ